MTSVITQNRLDIDLLVEESQVKPHICATCSNKDRIRLTTEDGSQFAIVWRCRPLTIKFNHEIMVEPLGNCQEAHSSTDFWEESEDTQLVW